MIPRDKCFLDMDGVIADFMGSLCRVHGKTNPYEDAKALGCWDTEQLWGISEKEFWAPIAGNSLEFWQGIEKTKEADEIVELVSNAFGPANVVILTAPSSDHGSVPGKRDWIERHYPQFKKRMIFATASAKQFMASSTSVLVDDKDSNVAEFIRAGGHSVLVPRPWNMDHAREYKLMRVLREGLVMYGQR